MGWHTKSASLDVSPGILPAGWRAWRFLGLVVFAAGGRGAAAAACEMNLASSSSGWTAWRCFAAGWTSCAGDD
eukprot:scaffold196085_cov31-Prasinocladus_malaysianus.AAC.1